MKNKIIIGMVLVIVVVAAGYLVISRSDKTLSVSDVSQTASSSSPEENIHSSFEGYRQALLDKDGVLAVQYLSGNTIAYYEEMLNLTKNGGRTEIQKKTIMDQVTILMMRHFFEPSEILILKGGRDSIIFAIENGLIGEDGTKNTSIGTIEVLGSTAKAQVIEQGKASPHSLSFKLETGEWKMDLTALFPLVESAVSEIKVKTGLTTEEFVLYLLENASGIQPTQDIWKPLI